MSGLDSSLQSEARAWLADDPDAATREELEAALARAASGDRAAIADLEDAFSGTLQFGTAGLRGRMGPGPNRMNIAVVSRAAAGLAAYLRSEVGDARVVIGYDARYHSRDFAERSAAIMVAAGHHVTLMPETWPTPVLAYAVRALDADCGIMVTASHNPAPDNGYKVYLGGRAADADGRGVQIVPPADALIAAEIAGVGPVTQIPVAPSGWDLASETLVDDYVGQITPVAANGPKKLRIVHTAMHGVGNTTMQAAFGRAGFIDVHSVPEQAVPDPDFPTVPFPNPEEKGAMDLALKLAERVQADLVIANDPDADRCAAAIYDERRAQWRMLHGDELGLLLATYLVDHLGVRGTLANSIVSSRSLAALATERGLPSVQTLTGFKWIARAPGIAFGYEEAIGYCVLPEVVKDKDGISAALAIAQLAAILKHDGSSLGALLDDLARQFGLYLTDQVSIRVEDLSRIGEMMERLRTAPPETLLGSPAQMTDLADGSVETTGLPPTDGLLILAEDGTRVIVRPSGTEPKLKAYLEVIAPVPAEASFEDLTEVRDHAASRITDLAAEVRAALGVQ
ncbi:MAG: phospho-sugar mutase [Dermabacter sp.]|nr:phospho-sugar mutase [Dermabacter sp.]